MSKTIVKAAIKVRDKIYIGFDHGECFSHAEFPIPVEDIRQGFITSDGDFVNRKEAMIIAKESGQLRYETDKQTLISEDLHIDWLHKQENKITELGKEIKRLNNIKEYQSKKFLNKNYKLKQQISDLEAKLAEKDKALDALDKIREMVSEDSKLNYRRYLDTLAKNEQLEQQLAEKEKEYNQLEILHYKDIEAIESCSKEIYKTKYRNGILESQHQDKISFCIEQLEKAKEFLLIESKQNPIVYDVTNDTIGGAIDRDKCFEIIDNQIKELKKGLN